ncbi:hypothetical protein NEOLEDRAFT_1125908 [Neolentinus lepideus HHB14362 ss-1]|uniref:Transmembrane protein 135 N-terminal domain-containing protein n=1 Tax=Neolentinus lepideus HHB14362 ss-1 TaxID=1314782 RepID=A0A165VYD8_9AGAM|nr:hypothetical protein NEOLEDRAFT_1125908 [Neolentinus lepideus HHB14362 ss-1]
MAKPFSQTVMKAINAVEDYLLSLPQDHPLQISLRTYGLALSLSLAPVLLPFITAATSRRGRARSGGLEALRRALKQELGVRGLAFAITTAIGGGAFLQHFWRVLEGEVDDKRSSDERTPLSNTFRAAGEVLRRLSAVCNLTPAWKTFICNAGTSLIALILLQGRKRASRQASIPLTPPFPAGVSRSNTPPPTLDLTLLMFVRAMDAGVQACLSKYASAVCPGMEQDAKARRKLTRHSDALFFWICSARIMWCFFYEPERLPRSYVKWITSIADIDSRLVYALRAIRNGEIIYGTKGSKLLISMAQDMGIPKSWGDAAILPPHGGPAADHVWKMLGVPGRNGIGGLPCEIVHGSMDKKSCTANATRRGAKAFLEALALYVPIHFLPLILTRPSALFHLRTLLPRLLSALRSATFLSTFVSSIWIFVCFTRTLFLPRLFPSVSHNFWDGPFGCIMAGCLACGPSIWIEEGRRRGEMALYVLPRAVRSCLSPGWARSGNTSAMIAER